MLQNILDSTILGRHWYDALLLFLLAVTFLAESVKIKRRTGLGRSMSAKAFILGCLFFYALFFLPPPPVSVGLGAKAAVVLMLRALLFGACVWELWELQVRDWIIRDDEIDSGYTMQVSADERAGVRQSRRGRPIIPPKGD